MCTPSGLLPSFIYRAQQSASMTVHATVQTNNFQFDHPALLDTGSDDCILPFSAIGKLNQKYLAHCDQPLYGISKKPIIPLGQIYAKISIGDSEFHNIRIMVVDVPIPFLIGKTLLFHATMAEFKVSSSGTTFYRKFGSRLKTHHATFINRAYQTTSATITDSLEEKLKWLDTQRCLKLPNDHHNQDELKTVADLLLKYEDCFGYEGTELGNFTSMVNIPTIDGMAKAQRQHPIAQQFQSVVDDEIEAMLKKGVIERCDDPKGFNSPIIVVKKKNGKPRVCANFKNSLNKCLADSSDTWQMPDTEVIFSDIGKGNKYFGSLDFKAGYWQCTIEPADRYKTSFQWGNRCFQWVRMPFGLTCAGDIFCRAISKALLPVVNKSNYKSYVDDLLLHSRSFQQYVDTLEMILQACRSSGIKLNSEKCSFLQNEAKFLGRIVCEDGYKADPTYVADLMKMPPPNTRKELQAMIGRFVWLRSFLETQLGKPVATHCFSNLMNPLNQLNRAEKKFVWTPRAQSAFELAKERLSSPSVIHFADFTKPFVLVTDASNIAVGAVILQKIGDKQVIIAAGSKTLDSTQQKWSTTEREAYAIIWACERFSYFLRGPKPFVLLTDHKSLIYMDRSVFANQKIARWQDRLSEFRFMIQYIEGENNVIADMMSRPFGRNQQILTDEEKSVALGEFLHSEETGLTVYVPSWANEKSHSSEIIFNSKREVDTAFSFITTALTPNASLPPVMQEYIGIADKQKNDSTLLQIINYVKANVPCDKWKLDDTNQATRIYIRYRSKFRVDPYTDLLLIDWSNSECIVVPDTLRPFYLKTTHDDAGHFGVERVADFLKHLWWPGKPQDIENYVSSCTICARRKGNYGKQSAPMMGHLLRGSKPFEVIYCDFVHMPQSSDGKRYILTIIDSFSRFLYCYPTVRDRAIDAAHGLVHFMTEYEIPKVISSDRGTHFVNAVLEDLCDKLHITQKFHTAWRPQSSGNIERAHRTLKNAIWATAADRNCSWTDTLPYVRRAMNRSKNSATGCSPYYTIYGKEPIITGEIPPGTELRSSEPNSYGASVEQRLKTAHKIIALANEEADKALEKRDNPNFPAEELCSGDEIYLYRPHSVKAVHNHLSWIGPYTVINSNGNILQIDQDGKTEWVHRFHVRKKITRKPELEVEIPPEESVQIAVDSERGTMASQLPSDTDRISISTTKKRGRQKRTKSLLPRRELSQRIRKQPIRYRDPTLCFLHSFCNHCNIRQLSGGLLHIYICNYNLIIIIRDSCRI